MTSATLRPLLVALVLLALAGAGSAKEKAPGLDALLSSLPEPTPAFSLEFAGDVIEQETWVGSVSYTVKAGRLADRPVWRVTEAVMMDGPEGEVREQRRLVLARDLTLVSGTLERTHRGVTHSLVVSRVETGYALHGSRRDASGSKTLDATEVSTPRPLAHGAAALALLLGAWRAPEGATLEVPWLDLEPDGTAKVTTLTLRAAGDSRAGTGDSARDTRVVEVRRGEVVRRHHLARDGRDLVAVEAQTARGPHVVPEGLGGRRVQLDENAPARTWEAAFLKFGFGYHMAREGLLEEAFHWDLMYAHEVEVAKRWDASRSLEEFKRAWIDEFIANSKRRTRVDAGRLLDMTLASGHIAEQTPTRVVFEAHPTFGGGVKRSYTFACRDGVWGIATLDF
jgi:hypothetical protein